MKCPNTTVWFPWLLYTGLQKCKEPDYTVWPRTKDKVCRYLNEDHSVRTQNIPKIRLSDFVTILNIGWVITMARKFLVTWLTCWSNLSHVGRLTFDLQENFWLSCVLVIDCEWPGKRQGKISLFLKPSKTHN